MEDDREILIKDQDENGTSRRSFSDREGQKSELRGDVEQASYGGKKKFRSNIKSSELNA